MSLDNCHIIVFAKAPVSGRVKTRLIPFLGPSAAAALYRKLVLHTLSIAVKAEVGPVDLWCSPSARDFFFTHCAGKFQVSLFNQPEGDLGGRMAHAFQETLKEASQALLIGTDCPALSPDELREAAKILKGGADGVIIPTEDGGYVLIGLRRYSPELFESISWGTESVLRETRERFRRLGWSWHELPVQWDVDRPEDLERLKLHLQNLSDI